MSLYLLGILGLVLLVAAISATWIVAKKKGSIAGLTFGLVAWLLPFAQLHSDDIVRVYFGISGVEAGFTAFMWGRSVIFIFQLLLAMLLACLWTEKEPIQPPQPTPLILPDSAIMSLLHMAPQSEERRLPRPPGVG